MVTVMTIAGFDPSCGAGIAADIKTFLALKVNPVSVATCITAQNDQQFYRITPVRSHDIALQVKAVTERYKVSAVKVGMIYAKENVTAVAKAIAKNNLKNVVLDPLIMSTTDANLINYDPLFLKNELFHHVDLITPNIAEAERLTKRSIVKRNDLKEAALEMAEFGCKNIVITGCRDNDHFIDMLYDGEEFIEFKKKALKVPEMHGSGCTFSAATAALMAQGKPVKTAVKEAKDFTYNAMKYANKIDNDNHMINQLFLYR